MFGHAIRVYLISDGTSLANAEDYFAAAEHLGPHQPLALPPPAR
ncbi:hypothetical protein [Limnoglobus roseus]|nr:hypothetical protein [Limnoglobus roseus]